MVASIPRQINTDQLEKALQSQEAPIQRMASLEKLIAIYAFVNVHRADELLQEMEDLLEHLNYPDQELFFHIHKGIVDNHLYKYESAVINFEKAMELGQQQLPAQELAEIYIDYLGVCLNLKELEKAEIYIEKADKLLKAFPDELLEARLACREGFSYLYEGIYSTATEFLLEAEQMMRTSEQQLSLKDCYFLMLIYGGLGDIYGHSDDQEKRIEAHLSAIEIAENTQIQSRLSWHYLHAGNGFMALHNLEGAESCFLRCLEIVQDANTFVKAGALANLGFCQMSQEAYEEALDLFEKAESLYRDYSPDDMRNVANICGWRAQSMAALGRNEEAKKFFYEALEYASAESDNKLLSNIYKEFAAFFSNLGDHKKAYEFLIQHAKYSELYHHEINEDQRLELMVKFEAEKEKQNAKLLRLEAAKLQMKALRAQMNPHFMYNALNAIQNYITSNKGDSAAKYLAKFAKLMRQSLYYSDLETISLEKELEFLEDYLYINQKLRFDSLSYSIIVDDEIEEDILGVPTMIVQPYVENAIEHGLRTKKNGHISLTVKLFDEDTILFIIEDDGIGRDAARDMQIHDTKYQNHRSKGTAITEERLRLLHNSKEERKVFVDTIDLSGESGQASGTRVEIKIPIVDIHVK